MARPLWHRVVEALLPWYDPADADAAQERSEVIHRNAIDARIKAEKTIEAVEAGGLGDGLREGYRQTGKRLAR